MPARLIAAFCLMPILSVALAAAPVVEPTGMWSGKIKDESLRRLAPDSGFIAAIETWKKLWTAWQPDEKDGKYEVEIDACAGFPLDTNVTLKPGQRRIINLTDNPAPNNVFIALEAPVSEKAKKRAAAMKANAKTFVLELQYNGDEDKPFYRVIVSVPVANRRRNSPFNRIVQVKEDEAMRIIDHLAREGFLDKAIDSSVSRALSAFSAVHNARMRNSGSPLLQPLHDCLRRHPVCCQRHLMNIANTHQSRDVWLMWLSRERITEEKDCLDFPFGDSTADDQVTALWTVDYSLNVKTKLLSQ